MLPDQRTHSKYWYNDGNVVLQAEHTLFRVHKSILSRHSHVFQDLFAIPHAPSQENEYIEGCPVIPLSDTAKDMSNIIFLLYEPGMALQFGGQLPATFLASMLRLGRKYGFATFEKAALGRLHHDCPTKLFLWDFLELESRRQIDFDHNPEDIISIAHEFRLFTTLPAAYAKYLQCRTLEGVMDVSKLHKHCILGYVRIQKFVNQKSVDALCPPLVLPSKTCSGAICEANKWEAIRSLPIWFMGDEDDSFAIFCPMGSMGPEVENLCFQCQSAVRNLTDEVRGEFWSLLPSFFDLPDWADLKDES